MLCFAQMLVYVCGNVLSDAFNQVETVFAHLLPRAAQAQAAARLPAAARRPMVLAAAAVRSSKCTRPIRPRGTLRRARTRATHHAPAAARTVSRRAPTRHRPL